MKISLADAETGETILARTVGELLADAGLEIDYFSASSGEARRLSSVHEGVAELSVGLSTMLRWAYRSEAGYDGWRHTSLRALVALGRPVWFALAARGDISDDVLDRIQVDPSASSVLCYPPDGHSAGWAYLLDQLLATRSIRLRDIRDAGGRLIDPTSDGTWSASDIDLVALPYGMPGLDHRAWARMWAHGLRPLPLDDGVQQIARRHNLQIRPLPRGGLVPDGSSPALYFPRTAVFTSERMPDDAAGRIVSVLHDHRDALLSEGFCLDSGTAFDAALGIPFHRAAISYYRETGALPDSDHERARL